LRLFFVKFIALVDDLANGKGMKYSFLLCLLSVFLVGCVATPPSSTSKELAKRVLAQPNKFKLANYHLSGKRDNATALKNMQATAAGYSARRSYYGKSPGGYCKLQPNMLRGMLKLADMGYSISISEIAGGSHSSNSRHYQGVAYDVTYINGIKVGWNNPYYRAYMKRARALGATEVLGPGDRGHSGHLHIAWPRP